MARQSFTLAYTLLAPSAKPPVRGSAGAAGFDLFSSADFIVPAHGRSLIPTGLAVAVPTGTYGRIAPRSGIALKHGIDVGGGVIDPDYRGELKVLLFNFGNEDFSGTAGVRVAQLICERICIPTLLPCNCLDESGRGENGFGSTGLKWYCCQLLLTSIKQHESYCLISDF